MTEPVGGPLAGTVVLDPSRALAGPHAAMMLADMGARAIKVETPGGVPIADLLASLAPPPLGEHDAAVRAWATDAS